MKFDDGAITIWNGQKIEGKPLWEKVLGHWEGGERLLHLQPTSSFTLSIKHFSEKNPQAAGSIKRMKNELSIPSFSAYSSYLVAGCLRSSVSSFCQWALSDPIYFTKYLISRSPQIDQNAQSSQYQRFTSDDGSLPGPLCGIRVVGKIMELNATTPRPACVLFHIVPTSSAMTYEPGKENNAVRSKNGRVHSLTFCTRGKASAAPQTYPARPVRYNLLSQICEFPLERCKINNMSSSGAHGSGSGSSTTTAAQNNHNGIFTDKDLESGNAPSAQHRDNSNGWGAYGGNPLAHMKSAESARLPAFAGYLQPGLYRPPSRKIANPAPLGLFGFALTTFVLSLLNWHTRGIAEPNIVVSLAYGYGGLVQLLGGMW